ncbi:MAG TPA: ABC transporter substrate-binding protein [Alphaproteobacteria bacterium]|nr:ABC transporter substrate-binding protein [Alphaproteobacteria bacterium]
MAKRAGGLTRRTVLKGAAALGAAGLAGPWLGGRARAAETTLRAGITGYDVINTLDPGKATLIPEYYVIWGVFNALLKFDDKMEIVPDLAESYKVGADGTLEFKLRPNVKFHDGSTMSAEDVKFTLERLLDPKFTSPNRSKVSAVSQVDAVDPLTVRIKTTEPFAPLLTFLCNARTGTQILPKKAVETMGDEAFGKKPVGTGAFMVKDWSPNQRVNLTAHPHYFIAGKPKLHDVAMPFIPEESSGVTALLGGQIDLTSTAPFADVPNLEKNKAIKVYKQAGLNTRFIALNNRKPPFDDVHFRRAVSLAFSREAMVKVVLFGEGVPSHGLIPPSLKFAYDPKPRELTTYNPKRAKEELAKAKYKEGTEAAILTWGAGWWKRIAEVFTAQVNQTLGTKLRVEVTEANTVYARQRAGDFQGSVWGWLGFVDPDEYLYDILYSKGYRNFQGYSNPKLDELLVKARQELDRSKRGEMYKQAEAMMIEDMPLLPCFCSNVHNLASTKVSGFVQLPYSNYGDTFQNLTLA